jgi:hypothetical protein
MAFRLALPPLLALLAAGALAAPAPAGGFRASADAACARYDRTTSALPQITSATELKRQLVLVPKLFRAMVDRIAAAPAPQAQRAQAARLVGSLRQVQRVLGQIRDAFLRGDEAGVAAAVRSGTAPSRVAARTAKALGLPVCSRLAQEAAKGPQP